MAPEEPNADIAGHESMPSADAVPQEFQKDQGRAAWPGNHSAVFLYFTKLQNGLSVVFAAAFDGGEMPTPTSTEGSDQQVSHLHTTYLYEKSSLMLDSSKLKACMQGSLGLVDSSEHQDSAEDAVSTPCTYNVHLGSKPLNQAGHHDYQERGALFPSSSAVKGQATGTLRSGCCC